MSAEPQAEDLALLEKSDKSTSDYLELQRRAFTTTKTRRALEKEVDSLRQMHDAGELGAPGTQRYGIYLALLGHHHDAAALLETRGADAMASFFRGRALRELGRYSQAVKALQPIADKDELYAVELIEAMIATGKLTEAAVAVTKLEGGKRPGDVAYLRGRLADAEGEYAEAVKHYERAVTLDRQHVKARFRMAFNHDLRGDEKLARAGYESLRDCKPPHANALINLGVIYEDLGMYTAAVDCYERILEIYPNHERARLFLKDAQSSMHEIVDEDRERRNDELTMKLRVPITDFELSVRSRNCLAKMDIKTLGDLVQKTESELLSYKNFGETSLAEIKEILNSKNLRLGMTLDSPESVRMPITFDDDDEDEEPVDEANAEILQKPIDFLELSVRSRKAMDRLDIATVGELTQQTEELLMAQKNFGQTSMNEVKSKLAQYGLKLKDS